MRTLHFDSLGGASGDMLLGALIDLGADRAALHASLASLIPEPPTLAIDPADSHGIHGTRATLQLAHHHHHEAWPDAAPDAAHPHHHHAPHRNLADIVTILEQAPLPPRPRALAIATFSRLAAAEAKIHGKSLDAIHFHEVGAADSIADVACCCLALDLLQIDAVSVGPLPCGHGTITCAHGLMPNPAPATLLLLQGMTVVPADEPFELVTPTGAALLATWSTELPATPAPATLLRSGIGFGQRHLQHRPNILRASLLESAPGGAAADSLLVLETNLDDCNPQWLGELLGSLLEAGALDAWTTPATMKKSRPAIILSVLCEPPLAGTLRRLIFLATPTFGIRDHAVSRTALTRRQETVQTPFGPVRLKIGSLDGVDIVRSPEFEDCAARARTCHVAPRQVADAARASLPPVAT